MQRAGVVVIVNAASSSFADMLSSFSVTDVKRQVVLLHSTPCMLKQTFVFRAPALVSATWQFVLSLMKQKARERVTFVGSIEELAQELGEGALTSDCGGSYESFLPGALRSDHGWINRSDIDRSVGRITEHAIMLGLM